MIDAGVRFKRDIPPKEVFGSDATQPAAFRGAQDIGKETWGYKTLYYMLLKERWFGLVRDTSNNDAV